MLQKSDDLHRSLQATLTWLRNCGIQEVRIVISGGRSGIDINKLKPKKYLNMLETIILSLDDKETTGP